jgi:hypothetical protein
MKILISGFEIANNIATTKQALVLRGHDVHAFVFGDVSFYSEQEIYDFRSKLISIDFSSYPSPIRIFLKILLFILNQFVRPLGFFWALLGKYDAYIYIWRHSFLPLGLDLFFLSRILKKRVVVIHCGDDTRYRPIQSKMDRDIFGMAYTDDVDSEAERKYLSEGSSFLSAFLTQKIAEWSGVRILSLRSHATFQKRPAHFFRFSQRSLMNAPKPVKPHPLIVHAPSSRVNKGTKYVLEAIEILKEKAIEFDFELIEGKPNDYVLEKLRSADILIDQTGPWFGRLAMEAFALGCVVFSGNRQDYYRIKDPSPAIQFNPDSAMLARDLENILFNINVRNDLMRAGFFYWKEFYSPEKFGEYIEKIICDDAEFSYFYPPQNYKALLLKFSQGRFQRLMIQLFY